ncbi:MAG: hypothetical protein PW789_11285 [Edaphobacter sp.]|uniref:hypothetical protein n=1 Tax=Edaphobacter sp. TaxID=1934404 RepID=UPI0023940BA6|nr:hypothetical protein [Edaphobacter sp.]MDE1177168.1 hypothetical protein [Edaphobacter sp.]
MTRISEMEQVNPLASTLVSSEEKKIILDQLETLMESTPFRGSQQCRRFLSYVVTHTLNSDDGSLRERVIGNAVFGRPPNYDTNDDPVVRLRASEVRKRLAQFYQSLEQAPKVTIQIPPGSYKATFFWGRVDLVSHNDEHLVVAGTEGPLLSPVEAPAPLAHQNKKPTEVEAPNWRVPARWLWALLAIIILFGVAGILVHVGQSKQEKAVRDFWQPLLISPKPALISVGSNAVYRVSDEVADQYGRDHHLEGSGMEFFPDLSPDTTIRSSGMHPAPDSFVALGDVAAISVTVSNLTRLQKPFQERFSNDISFAEIRSSPTVLVGGFNNPMTRELTKNLRFFFVSRNRIQDRERPEQAWVLRASQDAHDTEDYAIISRLLPQDGSSPIISVAGLGQYGTLAATEFVFNPERLSKFEHSAAKDWRQRNLQILLHIKVSDFKPAPGEVIAVHIW